MLFVRVKEINKFMGTVKEEIYHIRVGNFYTLIIKYK